MFYVLISLSVAFSICVAVSTFFFARYLAAKTRLVEKNIDDVIAGKLSGNKQLGELKRLREETTVMRNLLLDMVENEASLVGMNEQTPSDVKQRRLDARTARRRELFGEAMVILQKGPPRQIRIPHPAK